MTELAELVAELREEARCLAGEGIGDDLADKFTKAAAAIERLERERDEAIDGGTKLLAAQNTIVHGLREELEKVREALSRQGDNMSFILNRVGHDVLHAWWDKFDRELEEDRRALSEPDKEGML